MNKLFTAFTLIISLFFVSCSNMQTGFDEDSMFYKGNRVSLYVDKALKKDAKYKLYINNTLSDVILEPEKTLNFYLSAGERRISVVKDRQTAEINLNIEELKNYTLRLQNNDKGKIELIQVKSSSDKELNAVKEDEKILQPKIGETTISYERDDE